ncbi:MAG: DUF86 domain-containing protein [Chloroflexota bacterium]|nr:DUF86 domain-containing protein [Chloroflexota bacterium]
MMHYKSPKWLDDIASAAAFVLEKTEGIGLDDYQADLFRRYAVERTFEIMGEALLRIERTDPGTAARISDYRQVIGLRNRLAHGYDDIDNRRVLAIAHDFLPQLKAEVEELLREVGEP